MILNTSISRVDISSVSDEMVFCHFIFKAFLFTSKFEGFFFYCERDFQFLIHFQAQWDYFDHFLKM